MDLKYIDAHAHIHSKEFDIDRGEVIMRMKESEMGCITVGTSLEDSKKAVELAENQENVWATIGVHPTDTDETYNDVEFEELVKNKKVVAIGECGLDYFRVKGVGDRVEEEKERQKGNFIRQIEFALKHEKSLMIHCRPSLGTNDAHEVMIEILSSYFPKPSTLDPEPFFGNIHFFTGTKEIAERYFNLGFSVSISGVVTFAEDVAEVVKNLPTERILAETDCPYAAPVPHRGKRNEPIYVVDTMRKIAELKDLQFEKLAEQLLENTKSAFGI